MTLRSIFARLFPLPLRKSAIIICAMVAIGVDALLYQDAIMLDTKSGGKSGGLLLALVIILALLIAILAVTAATACVTGRHSRIRASTLADLFSDSGRAIKPFFDEICSSLGTYPNMGLFGLVLVFVVVIIALTVQLIPGHEHHSKIEIISFLLGFVGIMYGVLAYHVALRVDRSIRDSINNFSDFLAVGADILKKEILCKREYRDKRTDEQLGIGYDLMLLLWMPYYGLTRDAEKSGRKLDDMLKEVATVTNCRTHMIACENPFDLMLLFDNSQLRKYDHECLRVAADALRDKPPHDWVHVVEEHEHFKKEGSGTSSKPIMKAISALSRLLDKHNVDLEYWKPDLRSNQSLMKTHIQAIWTPKRAAIIFMPPISIGEHVREGKPELVQNNQFRCSGFVTQDQVMVNMIGNILEMRRSESSEYPLAGGPERYGEPRSRKGQGTLCIDAGRKDGIREPTEVHR